LSGASLATSGSSIGATRERGEPLHAGLYGDTSIWWSWTAPVDETVKISTAGSDFDTILAVYTGSTLSNLVAVASSDDEDYDHNIFTSLATLEAVAGQTYQIAVEGFDATAGHVSLSIVPAGTRLIDPMR